MKKKIEIRNTILELLSKRKPSETICPSEVARTLFPMDWRAHMEEVRTVAEGMVEEELIVFTQKGEVIRGVYKGPIRLRLS